MLPECTRRLRAIQVNVRLTATVFSSIVAVFGSGIRDVSDFSGGDAENDVVRHE